MLVALSHLLNVALVPEYTCSTPDYAILTLQYERNIFSVVYRAPQSNVLTFLAFIVGFLFLITKNQYALCMGGDLNTDMRFPTNLRA